MRPERVQDWVWISHISSWLVSDFTGSPPCKEGLNIQLNGSPCLLNVSVREQQTRSSPKNHSWISTQGFALKYGLVVLTSVRHHQDSFHRNEKAKYENRNCFVLMCVAGAAVLQHRHSLLNHVKSGKLVRLTEEEKPKPIWMENRTANGTGKRTKTLAWTTFFLPGGTRVL